MPGPVLDGMRVVREGVRTGERVIVNGLQRVWPREVVNAQTVPMHAGLTVAKNRTDAGVQASAPSGTAETQNRNRPSASTNISRVP